MANSIFKVHEMINKVGFEFDEATAKKVTQLAEKASQLAADNMTAELSKVVADIGDIFNKALSKLGKQQIDLSDMIKMPDSGTIGKLTNSFVSQITNSISDAIVKGINDGASKVKDNSKEINRLLATKKQLEQQKSALYKHYKQIEEYPDIAYKSYKNFRQVKLDKNVESQARNVMENYYQSEDVLYDQKRGTAEYKKALVNAFKQANTALAFGHTLYDNNVSLQDDETKKFFEQTKTSVAGIIDDSKYQADIESYIKELKQVLTNIPEKIRLIDSKIKELSASISNESLNNIDVDIDSAKKRINSLTPAKREKKKNEIYDSINYTPPESRFSLKVIADKYQESVNSGENWEDQYQWLVKFVRAYDEYSNKKFKDNREQKKLLEVYKPLYDAAAPQLPNAVNMLNSIINTDKDAQQNEDNKARQKQLIDELESYNKDALSSQEADDNIKKREEILQKLRDENLLTEEIENNYNEINKKLQARADLLRQEEQNNNKQKETNTSVSIMDKYSDMFKKAKTESANETEREADAQKTITEELNKQSKIVLFRRGKTEWNENNFRNTDMMGNSIWNGNTFLNGKDINGSIPFDQGGFGDGLWASTISGAKDLATGLADGESYFEIPIDNYNMLVVETAEFAEDFIDFSLKLQKFVLAAGKYRGFDEELNGVNEESLFSTASNLFERFNMSRQEFGDWIKSMQSIIVDAGLDERGVFTKADDKFLRSHNFGTRFMKTMGYQGVLTNTGNMDYDGNYYGSVIYDPDFKSIKEHLQKTGNKFQSDDAYLAYLNKEEQGIKNVTAAHVQALKVKEAEKNQVATSKENTDAIQVETKAKEELNQTQDTIVSDNQKKIESYKELCEVVEQYNDLIYKTHAGTITKEEENSLENLKERIEYTRGIDFDVADLNKEFAAYDNTFGRVFGDTTVEKLAKYLRIEIPQATETSRQAIDSLNNSLEKQQQLENTNTSSDNIVENKTETASIEEQNNVLKENIDLKNQRNNITDTIGNGVLGQANGTSISNSTTEQPTSAKVAIDSETLKGVLNSITINQKTQQNNSGEKAPWALESTLQTVKGVLDNIYTKQEIKENKQPNVADTSVNQDILNNINASLNNINSKIAVGNNDSKMPKSIQVNTQPTDKQIQSKNVKDSRDKARLGRASSALNTGRNVLESLTSIDDETIDISKIKEVQYLTDALEKLTVTRNKVNQQGHIITSDEANELRNATAETKKYSVQVEELVKNYTKFSGDNSKVLGNFIEGKDWKTQATEMVMAATNGQAKIKGFNDAAREVTYTLKSGKNEFTEYTAGVRNLDNKFVSLQNSTKKTEGFFDAIKRKTKEIFTYFSGSSIIYKFVNTLKRGIQYVKEIDSALTELKKVTDETEESYDKFLKTASKTSATIGSTVSDFTRATATFAKLGYNIDMASEMAKAAIVYKNVGDGIESADAAAESIISTMKGFGLQTSEAMAIVDRFNEVGNRFSITSKGIGDALQRSASALKEGGNTLDESIGLITAANSVVQDPETVGTALKTLTLRLRGAKTELEDAGLEADNMAETTSALQKKLLALTGGKVNIMSDANTFKNTTEILREMASAWKDMNDVQRANWCPYVQKCA